MMEKKMVSTISGLGFRVLGCARAKLSQQGPK